MCKMIVNLSNKKCKNNNKSTGNLNHIHKSFFVIIVETPEKDVSNIDRKLDKRKIRTLLIKSSLTLFSCAIRAMYNIVHRDQNQRLILKSFIPAINTSIFLRNIIKNIFSEKIQ